MFDPDDSWAQQDQAEAWSRAMALFQDGYELQTQGQWADAMACYRQSLALHPTAEAQRFLGWVLSFLKLYDEAIEQCRQAIAIDPSFGNPYNDIGAYLIEMDRLAEAIPWFERALMAPRYDARCYPLYNLGRIYEKLGDWSRAIDYYRRAVSENPAYELARSKLQALQARLN